MDLWWLWFIICPGVYIGLAVTLSVLWTAMYPSDNDSDFSFGVAMAWIWPITIWFWFAYLMVHDIIGLYVTKLRALNDRRLKEIGKG